MDPEELLKKLRKQKEAGINIVMIVRSGVHIQVIDIKEDLFNLDNADVYKGKGDKMIIFCSKDEKSFFELHTDDITGIFGYE